MPVLVNTDFAVKEGVEKHDSRSQVFTTDTLATANELEEHVHYLQGKWIENVNIKVIMCSGNADEAEVIENVN